MSTAAPPLLRLTEVEFDGQLLRFREPLEVEVELYAGEGASLWIESLELGATGLSEDEALEMLSDLLITAYVTYRDADPATLSPSAKAQWAKLKALSAGIYVLQN